jgi:hypothetical protein
MKRVLLSLLVATTFSTAALAVDQDGFDQLSNAQIEQQAEDLHPGAMYILAARLLEEGRGQEAANWMYAGQLRYRFMLEAGQDSVGRETLQFNALSEQVGRSVNEYIAGDVDDWIAAMEWALDWDAAHDNAVTSKTDHAVLLERVRAGLQGLIDQVEDNRESIPREREANGLDNR